MVMGNKGMRLLLGSHNLLVAPGALLGPAHGRTQTTTASFPVPTSPLSAGPANIAHSCPGT